MNISFGFYPAMDIAAFRSRIPLLQTHTHLNCARGSPLHLDVKEKLEYLLERDVGDPAGFCQENVQALEDAQKAVASVIGSGPDEVTFRTNTTDAIATAIDTVPMEKGDNAVIMDMEYPSVVYPLRTRELRDGTETRFVHNKDGRITPDMVEEAIDSRTRLVALSHVSFMNGYRLDIEEIGKVCRDRDVYFLVDAAQSLGTTPIDVREMNIDFLASTAFKWQLGVPGIAPLYVNKDIMDRIKAPYWGTFALKEMDLNRSARQERFDYPEELLNGANRFLQGVPNFSGAAALSTGLNLLLEQGMDRIAKRHDKLLSIPLEEYENHVTTPQESRAGIMTFRCDDLQSVQNRLEDSNFVVTFNESVRISPHFYNTEEEIQSFLDILFKHQSSTSKQ